MGSLVYNVRGTNGSGKTTIVRGIIKASKAEPLAWRTRAKPEAYGGKLDGKRIAILGSYETVCGGMDTITDINEAAEIIVRYATSRKFDLVLYEGLFISHMIGTVGRAITPFKDRVTLAFLDTPLDTCISRVVGRRLERGNANPFDPKNVVRDFDAVRNCRRNCIAQGFQVLDLDHKKADKLVRSHLSKGVKTYARQ
jgi:uridine kinase